MWMIPGNLKIYLYAQPTDMRRSFNRLAAMAFDAFGQEATDGSLYVFVNRRGDRIKILYWDRSGYALWYKQLQKGVFRLPANRNRTIINNAELSLILEGLEAKELRQLPRYHLPVA